MAIESGHGAKVFGVRPGIPFFYKISATGMPPLNYQVLNLPDGLQLDGKSGIITGILPRPGDYVLHVQVSNTIGKHERNLTIKAGNSICLTPPMGWNSWNAFGLSVTQEKVKAIAQVMIDRGLVDHGWTYVNIDDGWEAGLPCAIFSTNVLKCSTVKWR